MEKDWIILGLQWILLMGPPLIFHSIGLLNITISVLWNDNDSTTRKFIENYEFKKG